MTFKKLIIILTITVSLLITALLGTSYAWYQFDTAVTSFNNVSTYDENVGLAVVFTNSANINSTIEMPILASEVDEYSQKSIFTMTPNSTQIGEREIAYQISLVGIELDEKLTETEDFRYSLVEIKNGISKEIINGNFYNFEGNTLILKEMAVIEELDVTYNYEFRLWLQDNGCTLEQINDGECNDQNDLMGKSFSGKIKVSTALK